MKNYPLARLPFFAVLFLVLNFSKIQSQNLSATKINFIQNNLDTAKTLAASHEKLILVKFHAKYCLPCRVMDEHVWTDPALAAAVETNCIAVSVDIQNFDGVNLKNEFLVEKLPTILLMNACGKVLVRFETSSTASQILERLNFFNTSENKFCPGDPLLAKPFSGNFQVEKLEKQMEVSATPDAELPKLLEKKRQPVFVSQPVSHDLTAVEISPKPLVVNNLPEVLRDQPVH